MCCFALSAFVAFHLEDSRVRYITPPFIRLPSADRLSLPSCSFVPAQLSSRGTEYWGGAEYWRLFVGSSSSQQLHGEQTKPIASCLRRLVTCARFRRHSSKPGSRSDPHLEGSAEPSLKVCPQSWHQQLVKLRGENWLGEETFINPCDHFVAARSRFETQTEPTDGGHREALTMVRSWLLIFSRGKGTRLQGSDAGSVSAAPGWRRLGGCLL